MMPVLFEIGSFRIHGYAVMLALAFLVGSWVLSRGLRRQGAEPALGHTITALALVFGVAGAKALWLLEHGRSLRADPIAMLLGAGGMTWYGGLAVATAAIYVYIRRQRIPFASVLDAGAPALLIAYGIGRLGCHLAGDGDYGLPTSLPWGTDYSRGLVPPSRALAIFPEIAARYPGGVVPGDTPLHPTPVYEFLLALLGFVLLRALDRRRRPPGELFGVYLVLSATFRFAVEFLRLNPRIALGLSEAQLISVALFTVGLAGTAYLGRRDGPERQEARRPAFVAGDEVMAGVPTGRPLVLTVVGWALLWTLVGCVASGSLMSPSDADFVTSRTEFTGVRFEPTFVREDSSWKLPPSSTNVYWLAPGEEVRVKWKDLLVTADVGQGPKDCDLCAAMAARAVNGMAICDLAENHYVALMELKELGVIVDRRPPSSPGDLQIIGPLLWQWGCFSARVGPERPPSFTVSRSAQWAVLIVNQLDTPESLAVTLPRKPLVGLRPAIGSPVATFWVVPNGGRRVMDPRKLDKYVDIDDRSTWKWSVGATTDDGTRLWSENFSPQLAVGRVRVYKAKIVFDDPFFPECENIGCFQITGEVAPRRIRVYQSDPETCRDSLSCDLFFCRGDVNAADGNIDFRSCRDPGPAPHPTTPAAITDEMPARQNPLTWIVEFDQSAGFPAPTLADGEDLYIEFTLHGAP